MAPEEAVAGVDLHLMPGNQLRGSIASIVLRSSQSDIEERVQFCVFENGADDLIYVSIRSGGWFHGEFDLTVKGRHVYTGHIESLRNGGAIIGMGDVLSTPPLRGEVQITRMTGMIK